MIELKDLANGVFFTHDEKLYVKTAYSSDGYVVGSREDGSITFFNSNTKVMENSDTMERLRRFQALRSTLDLKAKEWITGFHLIHKHESHLAICLRWFNNQFVIHTYNIETDGYSHGYYLGSDIDLLSAKDRLVEVMKSKFPKDKGYTYFPLSTLPEYE